MGGRRGYSVLHRLIIHVCATVQSIVFKTFGQEHWTQHIYLNKHLHGALINKLFQNFLGGAYLREVLI